ncbi:MAG: PhnD/SsuA/transferrin family substrate-binding protein [Saccharofermentanales bacterium]
MKSRILTIFMAIILIISLVACQTKEKLSEAENSTESNNSGESAESKDSAEASESIEPEESDQASKSAEPEQSDQTSESAEPEQSDQTSESTELNEALKIDSEIPALAEPAALVAMKGPTAMGLAQYTWEKITGNTENTDPNLIYEIMTMPDQVATGLIKGDIDLACIPANLAASVFNKSEGKIQVTAINVLNVLHFATNNVELNSLDDLKGKSVYATGKGSTPEVILNNLLTKAGLQIGTDITINYLPEATEVAAKLQAEEGAVALLQEPFLSSVTMKNTQIKTQLNLEQLWQEYFGENSKIVTGVLVARKEFIEQNSLWFKQFLKDYQASAEWVNQNPAEAGKIIEEQGIIGAAIAEHAIPNIGISLITDQELQDTLAPYLEILATNNPELIGGKIPSDDFYYQSN